MHPSLLYAYTAPPIPFEDWSQLQTDEVDRRARIFHETCHCTDFLRPLDAHTIAFNRRHRSLEVAIYRSRIERQNTEVSHAESPNKK